jgi:hypothetical protein
MAPTVGKPNADIEQLNIRAPHEVVRKFRDAAKRERYSQGEFLAILMDRAGEGPK